MAAKRANTILKRALEKIDPETVERFSFKDIKTLAKVCKIHDPDTITVIFKFKKEFIKLNVRLEGIDAPEQHSKKETESSVCKLGIKALTNLIQGKIVNIHFGDFDKYGRVLARIELNSQISGGGLSVNNWLIESGYAREYVGGKKQEWDQDKLLKLLEIHNEINDS